MRMRRRGGGVVRPLSRLGVGEWGVITKVEGDISLKRRILEMGAVPGTKVVVERVAPLGDPIDVKLKDYHLSLRREEAEKILVE
jgi:Fe2+ transport system protein FeoA